MSDEELAEYLYEYFWGRVSASPNRKKKLLDWLRQPAPKERPGMTDQEIRDTLIELDDEMYIPDEGPVGPVLLREFDRIMAERDAASGYLEKIDGMLGTAYPNEILAVLKEWRGARGEG